MRVLMLLVPLVVSMTTVPPVSASDRHREASTPRVTVRVR